MTTDRTISERRESKRELVEARIERDVYKGALQNIAELDTEQADSGVLAKVIAEVALGVMSEGVGSLLDKVEGLVPRA